MNISKLFYRCGFLAMAVAVPVLGGSVQAETITFDEPGYVAGSVAPSPWLEEYGHTTGWGILPDAGVDGSQALYNGDSSGGSSNVAYDLPTALTSAAGVQRISILFNPAGPTASANFTDYGGVQVGNGSHMDGTSNFVGVLFRKTGRHSYGIWGPGIAAINGYGTFMAAFVPSSSADWYEITFETSDAWDTMTLGVGLVGETPATLVTPWDGSDISRIWTVRDDMRFFPQPAIYDNLVITPEPASMALVGCGLIGVLARRRKGHA